jgi:hypothetical protein
MKRLAYIMLLVLVFAVGLLWPEGSKPDTPAYIPKLKDSWFFGGGSETQTARQQIIDRLTRDGWRLPAAEIFATTLADLTSPLLESPVALKRLAALGQVDGVDSLLLECPEAAPLLALSETPEALANALVKARTSAERQALLSSCLLWPSSTASRDWALALQTQGPLIARLMEHATPEALWEIVVIDRISNPAASKAYDDWLADCLCPGGNMGSAMETASLLHWIKRTGTELRGLLSSNPTFVESLGKSWPALRSSITTHWHTPGEPCWHHLPPSLWTFMNQRPQDALALVEAQGPGICQIFCGEKAPPSRVHGALAGAYLAKRKVLANFILLFASHEDFQGVCQQTPFHLLEPACVYLSELGSEADIRERLANWNHEPAKLEADVVPNAVLESIPGGPILSLADKLWNGRIAKAGDYVGALISAYNIYTTFGSISHVFTVSSKKGVQEGLKVAIQEVAQDTTQQKFAEELASQLAPEAQRALGLMPPTPLSASAVDVGSQIPKNGSIMPATVPQMRSQQGHTILRSSHFRFVAELPKRAPSSIDHLFTLAHELATAAASNGAESQAWRRHLLSYTLWLLDQP